MYFVLDPRLASDSIALGDFKLCRLLMMNDCQYPWFTLVPKVADKSEIYQLSAIERELLWLESFQLSEVIMNCYKGDKLNVAAIGNIVSQLHLHHVVRFYTDICWPKPIWGIKPMSPYSAEAIEKNKKLIINQLKQFEFEPF